MKNTKGEKNAFNMPSKERNGKGTKKGTPFLTEKRNEAGTVASILAKERGRNAFLKNEDWSIL